MRKRFLVLLATLSCSGFPLRKAAPGDALVVDGKLEHGPAGFTLRELAALPGRTVRGLDPRVGRAATFQGVALLPLLAEDLPLQRGVDLLVIHGAGGYQAAVPLNAIRQSRPVLALQADGQPLDQWSAGAGPLMLAWPDLEAPGLDTDPRHRWWWVRGVARLEAASWQEGYGRALRVPPGAADEARPGAEVFAGQCMPCHSLRGRGGTVGPDLSSWPSAGEAEKLAAALRGHVAPRAATPAAPEVPPAQVRQLAAFLHAVALTEADRPQDEIKEPAPRPPLAPPPPGGVPRRP